MDNIITVQTLTNIVVNLIAVVYIAIRVEHRLTKMETLIMLLTDKGFNHVNRSN